MRKARIGLAGLFAALLAASAANAQGTIKIHDSALNREFVKAYREANNRNPDIYTIGGYDGMHLIYEALKKTGGNTDGESLISAARGMKRESPRGPISIDPETRDIIETAYIRRVEKVGGNLVNVEFDKVENVKDPVKARMKTN